MNMVSLPIDYIKIDRCFINNIGCEEGGKLVEDMISLIHHLGKKVLAEGVETIEQLETLKDMNCDYVQGYYYSKPVPAAKVAEVISRINDELKMDYTNGGIFMESVGINSGYCRV